MSAAISTVVFCFRLLYRAERDLLAISKFLVRMCSPVRRSTIVSILHWPLVRGGCHQQLSKAAVQQPTGLSLELFTFLKGYVCSVLFQEERQREHSIYTNNLVVDN